MEDGEWRMRDWESGTEQRVTSNEQRAVSKERFSYRRAGSVEEAVRLLNEPGVRSRALAGGTDLMLRLRHEKVDFDRLVDVSLVPEMRRIERQDGRIVIGASVTFSDLLKSPLIRQEVPMLAEMAAEAGAVQLRNMGTLGGNIANAALAADSLPVLICLEAQAILASAQGRWEMPVVELVVGPHRTRLEPGTLIVGFAFEPPPSGARTTFFKIGRRNALNIARLSVAAIGRCDTSGRVDLLRLVPGAALPHTHRVTEVEDMLLGRVPDPDLLAAAGQRMAEVMVAEAGRRWSTPYKEPAIAALTERALRSVLVTRY